jgi:hypothetical protein
MEKANQELGPDLNCRALALQVQGSEFIPQYCQKKKMQLL